MLARSCGGFPEKSWDAHGNLGGVVCSLDPAPVDPDLVSIKSIGIGSKHEVCKDIVRM